MQRGFWPFVTGPVARTGRPDLSQLYSRRVMNFSYSAAPDGLPGNDDFGAAR